MMRSHRIVAFALVVSLAALPAAAAAKSFAYNNTSVTTFTGVYLAPAATTNWGANEALNDNDHSLDFGERLLLTGIAPGRYDVKLVTDKGKTCVLKGVDLSRNTSFEIRDGDLAGCR
jgi:hypothetical protein